MRRAQLGKHTFEAGFQDSQNPLQGNSSQLADGSANVLILGEGYTRPFKGFYTQGSGTGSRIMTNLGNTWGGLRDYSNVTAQGSLLEDYSKTLFVIGAGEATKEGIPLVEKATDFTFAFSDVTASPLSIAVVGHGLTTGEPVFITNSLNDPPAGITENTAYFAINLTANTFSLASTYKNALAGTRITVTDQGTGTNTLYSDNGTNPIRASSVLQVGYNQEATYFYEYVENAGLPRVDTPVVTLPTAPSAAYTGQVNGAVNFKIAAIRDYSNDGVDIDNPTAPIRGLASSASVVVLPLNNTVKIAFPSAVTGQTHWAVFATKEGFGGTGDFYRLGYRTSSDADAVWYFGISETTVAAATDRTLEFDFRTGDLLPELAWIQDYEPPVGTHCVRLENIMVVLGAYDGTVGAVSLPNYFESYNPFHLLYFPEPVTATLSRQIDNYAFVACRNSIHTIQYVGYRGDELPSATITTISPEVGIAYQYNWALGGGNIALFLEGAGIAIMTNDGTIDYSFGKEVAKFTKSWTPVETSVSFDPNTRSFVYANNGVSLSFCLESGVWSAPVYITDTGVTGEWVSGINAQGDLYVTLENGGTYTAYKYDDNTSTTRMPAISIGQWINSSGRSVGVYELEGAIRQGNNTENSIIGVHKNLFRTYIRGCSTTNASNTLTAPANTFTSAFTNKRAAVLGTDIGGAGVHYILAKLTYVSDTQCTMTTFSGGALTAQATLSNVTVIVGEDFFAQTVVSNSEQHLPNVRPAVQDCRSFCASLIQATDASEGACFEINLFGTPHATSNINT